MSYIDVTGQDPFLHRRLWGRKHTKQQAKGKDSPDHWKILILIVYLKCRSAIRNGEECNSVWKTNYLNGNRCQWQTIIHFFNTLSIQILEWMTMYEPIWRMTVTWCNNPNHNIHQLHLQRYKGTRHQELNASMVTTMLNIETLIHPIIYQGSKRGRSKYQQREGTGVCQAHSRTSMNMQPYPPVIIKNQKVRQSKLDNQDTTNSDLKF